MDVISEEGSESIPKVCISSRRKKHLWSKHALVFAKFLQLQARLLQPTHYRTPELEVASGAKPSTSEIGKLTLAKA